MSDAYGTLRRWKEAFQRAAHEALGGRADGPDRDSYRIRAGSCRRHGTACACVVYGALLGHYRWAQQDPLGLARQLVATMLPSADVGTEPAAARGGA